MASYDHIGTIAIFDAKGRRLSHLKKTAEKMSKQKSIKTVMARFKGRKGKHRIYSLKHLAGECTTVTQHKENDVILKVDVARCYFTPRLSGERLRIARQVRKGESVLVMFSGVAPYCLVIARHALPAKVVGIEVNRTAHKYALQNVSLNKLQNKIALYCGDVRQVVRKLHQKFDRIIMPLPLEAEKYIQEAVSLSKKGTVVHLYKIIPKDTHKKAVNEIRTKINSFGKQCKKMRVVRAGKYAPRQERVCVDFVIC